MIKSRRKRTDADNFRCCMNCKFLRYKRMNAMSYYKCGIDGAYLQGINNMRMTVCDKHKKAEEEKK